MSEAKTEKSAMPESTHSKLMPPRNNTVTGGSEGKKPKVCLWHWCGNNQEKCQRWPVHTHLQQTQSPRLIWPWWQVQRWGRDPQVEQPWHWRPSLSGRPTDGCPGTGPRWCSSAVIPVRTRLSERTDGKKAQLNFTNNLPVGVGHQKYFLSAWSISPPAAASLPQNSCPLSPCCSKGNTNIHLNCPDLSALLIW